MAFVAVDEPMEDVDEVRMGRAKELVENVEL